jgi:hypothetical protein
MENDNQRGKAIKKEGTAAYVIGFLDGKRHWPRGIALPPESLAAPDDYARGLRAGYRLAECKGNTRRPIHHTVSCGWRILN